MKPVKLLIILFTILSGSHAFSQEKYVGLRFGIAPSQMANPFKEVTSYLFGIKGEIKPKNAIFTFSTEIQYIPKAQAILTPIGINFRIGKKTKLRLGGGVLPMFSLRSINPPNKLITIGAILGTGIEIPTSKRFSILTECGLYFIPSTDYRISPGGMPTIVKKINHNIYLSLGVQYHLNKKK
jgi:hypothetical protein